MKDIFREKIFDIVNDKLSNKQINDLIHFLRKAMDDSVPFDDDDFFRGLAHEMTGQVKELVLLIIDFRRDLQSKIQPDLTDIATKYIPQTTDQLEGVIETTEVATNKIMDNLEEMENEIAEMKKTFGSLKEGNVVLQDGNGENVQVSIGRKTQRTISPIIDYAESRMENYMSLISDSFIQMSFQDLTGQRIKRIMTLVKEIEEKLKRMVISFGIMLTEKEKNPGISKEELERVVKHKITELEGPQREGQGLNQAGIDELLSSL